MLSLKTKAYYLAKPAVPQFAVLGLRRWLARRKRAANAGCWPVDPRAGHTPPGWPGWPEGKRFALVLTHDVEGPQGLAKLQSLVDLEVRHGFRASYNFVPGDGEIPEEARRSVEAAGGEVGVHGLEHDGKLFFSKPLFEQKAARIRDYLREWKASGFRAPFMHHNLAWIHKLGVEYDASTFDTDPFEPQPDGVCTIFPFWVAAPPPEQSGYVELPYTLVQDFTLFRILGETDIEVWKRKLDWVAERGGMALLDTHPDYMHFGGSAPSETEYPAKLYEEFLEYAKSRYAGAYWHALPREVARYYREALPRTADRNTRKRICMVTQGGYEPGSRIRCYAEALAGRGDFVDVLIGGDSYREETICNVTIVTIPRGLGFLARMSAKLTSLHGRILYDFVHVHDSGGGGLLGFTAYFAKLGGAKVILDREENPTLYKGLLARRVVSLLKAHVIHRREDSSGDKSTAAYPALVDTLAVESFTDLPAAP